MWRRSSRWSAKSIKMLPFVAALHCYFLLQYKLWPATPGLKQQTKENKVNTYEQKIPKLCITFMLCTHALQTGKTYIVLNYPEYSCHNWVCWNTSSWLYSLPPPQRIWFMHDIKPILQHRHNLNIMLHATQTTTALPHFTLSPCLLPWLIVSFWSESASFPMYANQWRVPECPRQRIITFFHVRND
jgi:hypothetical protein